MGRGQLTEEIQVASQSFLDQPITVRELRLLPYIQYQICNSLIINPTSINFEERTILKQWESNGYLENPFSEIKVTKEFWDFMCQMIGMSYVTFKEPKCPTLKSIAMK